MPDTDGFWTVVGRCPHGRDALITFDELGYLKVPSTICPENHVLPKRDAQATTPGRFAIWRATRKARRQLRQSHPDWMPDGPSK